ncbi:MAG: Tetratricopeptide 4 [Gemmatimonadetes bacterium]|nr:Tetratricopeptide 4 [Gemmatimonadota bacterium]
MTHEQEREGHDPEAIEELVRDVESLGAADRWDEAYERLREALREEGEDATVLCWLGVAAERLGREGEAYEYYRRSLDTHPTDPFLLASAGSGLASFDDPDAEGALRLAAITAPDFAFGRMSYGSYLAREGLMDESLRELEAARALTPEDPIVRLELGIALLLANRGTDALAELEEALSHGEEHSWIRGLYGLALSEVGRGEAAAEELYRASLEREGDVELHLASALASAAQGWEDESWNALARAEQAAEPEDRTVIGEVEEHLNLGADAAEAFLRGDLGPTLLRERLLQRP